MRRKLLIPICMLLIGISVRAQIVQPTYDEQKYKLWNSMENGEWDFDPGLWFYFLHKNYSGASLKWEWHGFKSGLKVRYDEDKSNIGRVMLPRAAHIAALYETKQKNREELDTITPLYNEEMERLADRLVDVTYPMYKEDFEKLQNNITKNLSYCLEKSNGNLAEVVALIQNANDLVLDEIEYIHKQGPDVQIENAKRQIAYEEAKKKLEAISSKAFKLVVYAKCHY